MYYSVSICVKIEEEEIEDDDNVLGLDDLKKLGTKVQVSTLNFFHSLCLQLYTCYLNVMYWV